MSVRREAPPTSTSSMQRLRGQLLHATGQERAADAAYRMAQSIARKQGALYLEIGAAVARCELAQVGRLVHEAKADLEALLGRWSDPRSPPHVAQARAWIQRAQEQQ
jgi:hypothetical protein